jgi:DNA-binding transcriptional LysR family regulator
MLAFVKVVENGSISAASRAGGQTPSAVSKQIGLLEEHVGHRLLHRTRTGVSLTAEGRDYFEKCKALARSFEEAEAHIQSLAGPPKGTLRVTSSVAFGKSQLIPALPEFLAQNPGIHLSLELTDRPVDLEAEDIDAAIRFAEQLDDPRAIVRKIMENERILCASPEFLARYGAPRTFADLANFNCLRTSDNGGRNAWRSVEDGEEVAIDANGNFECNSADVVYNAALAGLGIARLSSYLVADSIRSGTLVRVLPDYTQKNADIAVIFAERRLLAPRIRVFVDFLAQHFRGRGPLAPEGAAASG